MPSTKPLFAACVLILGMMAGCVGEDPAGPASVEPSSTVSVSSPDSNATVDVGSIEGTVRDDESAPIQGASVAIHGTEVLAETDEAGHFAFTDVPTGSYDILTNILGFENGAQRTEVLAGETSFVNFTLNPIEVAPDPYTTVETFEGLITCGFVFVPVCGVLDESNQDYGTPNPTEEHWLFNWQYGHSIVPTAVVFELVWQPTVPETSKAFTILGLANFTASATGPSVLKAVIEGDEFKDVLDDPNTNFAVGVFPELEPVVNQRFTLYRTDFFYGEPAEDYSILNSG